MTQEEVNKLRQHLKLLKEEYSLLQTRHNDLESKHQKLSASLDDHVDSDDTFAHRLLNKIKALYRSEIYSDLKVKLKSRELNVHKLVLTSRSDEWNDNLLSDKSVIDWSDLEEEIAEDILKFIYTNEVELKDDEITLKLMAQAFKFKLYDLVKRCEMVLIKNANVRNCVKFYSYAEESDANRLKEYCSGLISTFWDDLGASDFEHMSGQLLYKMLAKSQLPLHAAVKLQREDVVFLCLVENSSKLSDIVNLWGPNNDLPLDLALKAKNESIATTLIQHNADVNIRDPSGDTLLHRAIKNDDDFSALFLLHSNCDATLTTRSENDSALHLLAGSHLMKNSLKIAEKLINRNVNINARNRQGFTALHIAIISDNRNVFDVLLHQENLDLNVLNDQNKTPLYYALRKYEAGQDSRDSYALQLLEKGAKLDLDRSDNDDDLLQILLIEKAEKTAMFLLEKTSNINHKNKFGETLLHTACLNDCPQFIDKVLKLGANANLVTFDVNRSPLHYAIDSNSERCIKAFIEFNKNVGDTEKVNFNLRDCEGDAPVSYALNLGKKNLVPILIKGGADVNVRNGKDFTLLHQAILKEDSEIALFLLELGADMNAKTTEYETPLQLAIHCRLGDVVDALCTRGVDTSAPDRLGNCALWAALDSGQDDIASVLVQHGADTDCWGAGPDNCRQTLLHRAIDENKEPAAIFLIQAGCDLNSPRKPGPNGEGGDEAKDNASPLHLCCQWGLEPVVQTLAEHGANVNSRDLKNKTPLHYAIENHHDSIIELLLRVPEIDLNLRDKSGLSPFASALTFRNNKAAQAILNKFPSAAEQFDSKGYNFLHTAIKKGDIESVLFLLSINVNVNSRVQDTSLSPCLHLAAQYGNETLVRSLLLAGARIEDVDSSKRTALHVASECGNTPIVAALLQNHIPYNATDTNGDNALHVAVREGHLNVVKTLLTESEIDAEAVNIKGRNPLHELCYFSKDNSAAICEFFLESMPEYPIDRPDVNGNTPLLLAYMRANGQLCRVLVRAKASLAIENNENVNIFNYQVPTKQLLSCLLDQLAQPIPWKHTTDSCQECGKLFTVMFRKHHCRHCGRVLCGKCSDQETPIIKFGENKPVRVCRICFEVLRDGARS
nr:rabankyrin-5 [Onthophagus taurus]